VLTPAEIEQVALTVRKTPEVLIKVSGGARDTAGAKAHFDYIDRHGKLAMKPMTVATWRMAFMHSVSAPPLVVPMPSVS
jgi:hypothetical protein